MANAKNKKPTASKKIADVKTDGDGAVGTSRPVIVSNRPIVKDPMMAEISQLTGGVLDDSQNPEPIGDPGVEAPSGAPEIKMPKKLAIHVDESKDADTPAESTETPAVTPSKKKLVIQPLSEKEKPADEPAKKATEKASPKKTQPTVAELAMPDVTEAADDNAAAAPAPSSEPASKDAEQAPADDTESPAASADSSEEKAKPDDAPTTNAAPALQPGRSYDENEPTTKDIGTTEPEEIELDTKGNPKVKEKKSGELTAAQQKAIENEEYFLPITTAETKRMHREVALVVLLVLVLVVIWLDILLDAGLLKIHGIKAVTNFF